jgi:hypothetical protein
MDESLIQRMDRLVCELAKLDVVFEKNMADDDLGCLQEWAESSTDSIADSRIRTD